MYMYERYNVNKIKSFADKETKKIYEQTVSLKLPLSIQAIALRKLIMIDNSADLNDLRVPPANHLEKLCGYENKYSIRINNQFRICFDSSENGYHNVEIVDYH